MFFVLSIRLRVLVKHWTIGVVIPDQQPPSMVEIANRTVLWRWSPLSKYKKTERDEHKRRVVREPISLPTIAKHLTGCTLGQCTPSWRHSKRKTNFKGQIKPIALECSLVLILFSNLADVRCKKSHRRTQQTLAPIGELARLGLRTANSPHFDQSVHRVLEFTNITSVFHSLAFVSQEFWSIFPPRAAASASIFLTVWPRNSRPGMMVLSISSSGTAENTSLKIKPHWNGGPEVPFPFFFVFQAKVPQ